MYACQRCVGCREVLVMVMRKHQRYFPLSKPDSQELLPHFITVANGPIDIPTVKVGCPPQCLLQLFPSLPCPQLPSNTLCLAFGGCPLPCAVPTAAGWLSVCTTQLMHAFPMPISRWHACSLPYQPWYCCAHDIHMQHSSGTTFML